MPHKPDDCNEIKGSEPLVLHAIGVYEGKEKELQVSNLARRLWESIINDFSLSLQRG